MLLQPKSRKLFGCRVRFSAANLEVLREEGLLSEGAVQKVYRDGSADVLLQARTLVQGGRS